MFLLRSRRIGTTSAISSRGPSENSGVEIGVELLLLVVLLLLELLLLLLLVDAVAQEVACVYVSGVIASVNDAPVIVPLHSLMKGPTP